MRYSHGGAMNPVHDEEDLRLRIQNKVGAEVGFTGLAGPTLVHFRLLSMEEIVLREPLGQSPRRGGRPR